MIPKGPLKQQRPNEVGHDRDYERGIHDNQPGPFMIDYVTVFPERHREREIQQLISLVISMPGIYIFHVLQSLSILSLPISLSGIPLLVLALDRKSFSSSRKKDRSRGQHGSHCKAVPHKQKHKRHNSFLFSLNQFAEQTKTVPSLKVDPQGNPTVGNPYLLNLPPSPTDKSNSTTRSLSRIHFEQTTSERESKGSYCQLLKCLFTTFFKGIPCNQIHPIRTDYAYKVPLLSVSGNLNNSSWLLVMDSSLVIPIVANFIRPLLF